MYYPIHHHDTEKLANLYFDFVKKIAIEKVKGKCWDYSPIVQRPYGPGVAKTLLRSWRHKQVGVLDLGLKSHPKDLPWGRWSLHTC